MHKFKLSYAKTIVQNLSKQSQTFPKRLQTNSSNSENLRRWYVQRLTAFPSADCLPSCKNNMQYLMPVTCQLKNPPRLIVMVAKTATSSDATKQSSRIHIRRQHIQMLRPKHRFLTSNSDLNVPFCGKLSRKGQCIYQTASIQPKTSQMQKWIHPRIGLLAAKHFGITTIFQNPSWCTNKYNPARVSWRSL